MGISSRVDISDMKFGNWTVLNYFGNRIWNCKCSCGVTRGVSSYALRKGTSTSCGHEKYIDMIGKTFGEWEVVSFSRSVHGNLIWNCRCSCGEIREVHANSLRSDRSKSCGHTRNSYSELIGRLFGEWAVIEYNGGTSCKCKCSCGTIKDVDISSLLRNKTKSCGCISAKLRKETLMEQYGDIVSTKNREKWQIDTLESRDKLIDFILSKGDNVTAQELSNCLDVNTNTIYRHIHSYNIDHLIKINYNSSKYETEICKIIKKLGVDYEQRNKSVLSGTELDIYIPEKKLAIEFNGNYWHSILFKDKMYHQHKTIECAEQGIHLIHIFEYEWADSNTKDKLINLITGSIIKNNVVYARNTQVKVISTHEYNEFLDKTHLQGRCEATVKLGLTEEEKLLGVMSFGKPRFNNYYEWEIIRLAWENNTTVVGGAEKLFKAFKDMYKPKSIISYCDISKFTGKIYNRLGLNACIDDITEPNYVWYNYTTKKLLSRYQTQKHKLLKNGLGTAEQTEIEIMEDLGFTQIYDCGNLKFTWRENNGDNKSNTI